MSQINVLSVGDIVTDAFIKLFDDYEHTYANEQGRWLAMPFGTKVPFDHAEIVEGVGNAANASVCFARLGLHSGLVTNIGEDKYGRDMISALHKNKVDTRFVRINPDKKSNYHYVLWYREERTILIKHEDYNYHWPHLAHDETPRWVYFSSVGKNGLELHDKVAAWLEDHPEIKLAFQPGTFEMKAGVDRLHAMYKRAEVLLLNREEAALVGGGNHDDVHDLFDKLHNLGPKIVVITDGPSGAYASGPAARFKMPNYPDPKPPYERTGAGDAFSSTFVAALIKGCTLEEALKWAPISAMNVVQHVGAQAGLLQEAELKKLLEAAPPWYEPERL